MIAQMRRAIPSDQAGIRALLREPAHAELSLAAFLRETDVALDDVYVRIAPGGSCGSRRVSMREQSAKKSGLRECSQADSCRR